MESVFSRNPMANRRQQRQRSRRETCITGKPFVHSRTVALSRFSIRLADPCVLLQNRRIHLRNGCPKYSMYVRSFAILSFLTRTLNAWFHNRFQVNERKFCCRANQGREISRIRPSRARTTLPDISTNRVQPRISILLKSYGVYTVQRREGLSSSIASARKGRQAGMEGTSIPIEAVCIERERGKSHWRATSPRNEVNPFRVYRK